MAKYKKALKTKIKIILKKNCLIIFLKKHINK